MGAQMRVPGFLLLLLIIGIFELDVVCGYIRPPPRQMIVLPNEDENPHLPQQVQLYFQILLFKFDFLHQ